jgi:hypothetical protein
MGFSKDIKYFKIFPMLFHKRFAISVFCSGFINKNLSIYYCKRLKNICTKGLLFMAIMNALLIKMYGQHLDLPDSVYRVRWEGVFWHGSKYCRQHC